MKETEDFLKSQLTKILNSDCSPDEKKELDLLKKKLEATNQALSEKLSSADILKVKINSLKKQLTNPSQLNLSIKQINQKNQKLIKKLKKIKLFYTECKIFNLQLENKNKKLKNVLKNLIENLENKVLIENEVILENELCYENRVINQKEIINFEFDFSDEYSKNINQFLKKAIEFVYLCDNETEEVYNFKVVNQLLINFFKIISFYEGNEFSSPQIFFTTQEKQLKLDCEIIKKNDSLNKNESERNICKIEENLKAQIEELKKENELLKYNINNLETENEKLKIKNKELLSVIKEISKLIKEE